MHYRINTPHVAETLPGETIIVHLTTGASSA